MNNGTKKQILIPLIILGLAFVVRLVYVFQIKNNAPDFDMPMVDAYWHHLWAIDIAKGDLIGKGVFFRAPFYPYFLGLLYYIGGVNYILPRVVQAVMGSISCLFIYCLGKKVYNKQVGLIASALAIFYGPFIYYEGEYLMPALIIFLNLAAMILLFKAYDTSKKILYFLTGIILGLSAITRPDILGFVFCLSILLAVVYKNIRNVLLICTGMAVIIAPVTTRNYLVGRDFVPIATQGGINFYLGNNPESDGKTAIALEGKMPKMGSYVDNVWLSSVNIAEKEKGANLKPSQISNYWFGKGLDYIKQYPKQALMMFFKKAYYYCNSFEIESNKSIYVYKKFSPLLDRLVVYKNGFGLPFGLIVPLAFIGIILSLKEKNFYSYIFILYILASSFAVIAFFVVSRFRVPVVPILLIYTALSLQWLYARLKDLDLKKTSVFIFCYLIIFFITNTGWWGVDGINKSRQYALFAIAYDKKNDLKKAEEFYLLSIKEDNNPYAYDNLGIIYYKQGRHEQAFDFYSKAVYFNPAFSEPHNNLGVYYAERGNYPEALKEFETAVSLDPGSQEAVNNVNLVKAIMGKKEK